MTKPAAKAVKPKPKAKAKKAATKLVKTQEEGVALDWPPGLTQEKSDCLFDLVESGDTIRRAAPKVQLKGNTVYQWKRRYKAFAERLMEAEEVGYEMMLDFLVEDAKSAQCRDTAAATKERREAAVEFLRRKNPQRFNTSPFKASGGDGDTPMIVGVVLVPQRSDVAGVPMRPAIEGVATQVTRLDPTQAPAPAFTVRADG